MADWQPLLQLLHVTDLHMTASGFRTPLPFVQFALYLNQLSTDYADRLLTSVVPHDPFAVDLLAAFLPSVTRNDPLWGDRPCWLVDTGDGTSFGDDPSLELWRDTLEMLQRSIAPEDPQRVPVFSLYGNHDAWPADQPLNSTSEAIDSHRERLRRNYVDDRWPADPSPWPKRPLSFEPNDPELPAIDLYGLNSVLHDRWRSFLAIGELTRDRFWDDDANEQDQLQKLEQMLVGDDQRPRLRIVATHHPVHFPPPRPQILMYLENDQQVGKRLDRPAGRPIQLLLSGHVHVLYPPAGELVSSNLQAHYPPLPLGTVPLLVGSLLQTSLAPSGWSQQCQLLRFLGKPGESRILCRRYFIARPGGNRSGTGGFGTFALVRTPDGRLYEELELDLR